MIRFMSLIRPAGQPAPATPPAGTAPATGGQPANFFAALVRKLLGDLGGGTAVAAAAEAPAQSSFPFVPKGAVKSVSPDPAAENDPRPVKPGSKETPAVPQGVIAVQQPGIMQVLNLVPPSAGPAGVAGSPSLSGAADGSLPGGAATAGPEIVSAVGSVPSGNPPVSSAGQMSFPGPLDPPDAGSGMLLSFLKNVSTFGARVPLPPGSPVRSVLPDQGVRVEPSVLPDQTMTPELTRPESTITPGLSFGADQSTASLLKPDALGPVVSGPHAPAPNQGPINLIESKTEPANPSQVPGQAETQASSQPLQIPLPAQTVPVMPELQVVSPGVIDPTLLPRVASVQPRKSVDPVLPGSGETREAESVPPDEDAPAARAGFFTTVIGDVLGTISGRGGKPLSPDQQGSAPLPPPLAKSNVAPAESAPAFADVQAQPVKKTADAPVQDAGPVYAAEATRPVHEQGDLTLLRSSQVAQVSQALPDKQDSAGAATPLRDVPSPYAPLPAEVSRRIADQVVQNLKLQVDGTTSDIRMTLKPPSLGDVQLSVHVEDSRMQAQINVTQQVVKTALEAHMPQLRQALQEHGIEVQRIDVMLPEQSLHHDGTGANGDRTGRRGGRRVLAGDDTEAYREAKDMGYNTIELIM